MRVSSSCLFLLGGGVGRNLRNFKSLFEYDFNDPLAVAPLCITPRFSSAKAVFSAFFRSHVAILFPGKLADLRQNLKTSLISMQNPSVLPRPKKIGWRWNKGVWSWGYLASGTDTHIPSQRYFWWWFQSLFLKWNMSSFSGGYHNFPIFCGPLAYSVDPNHNHYFGDTSLRRQAFESNESPRKHLKLPLPAASLNLFKLHQP